MTLAAAQHAIAANWWAAYQTYLATPAPSQPTRPAPVTSPASTPSAGGGLPVVHPGAFCSYTGARGITTLGTPMICKTTATDSRLRWRSAT
jgi:hypothetical protein